MQIIPELLQEHQLLKELFLDSKEVSTDHAARATLLRHIYLNLAAHARAEEETIYAEMAKADSKDVLAGTEEHHLMDGILAELIELPTDDETWSAKMEVLRENALHHLQEEEETLFARTDRLIVGSAAEELGNRYRAAFTNAWKNLEDSLPQLG